MAYDEGLALRLEEIMTTRFDHLSGLTETRMFGGFGYMLNGNMCFGLHKDMLIVRLGVEGATKLLEEEHVRVMDLTGKVMKGWAMIEPEAMDDDEALARFCSLAIEFVLTLPPKEKKK